MLRSNYEKSTDLINHFIITEHKELNGTIIGKYNSINLSSPILECLYTIIKILKFKNYEKK